MAENLGLALAELFGRDVLEDARLAELALVEGEALPDVLSETPDATQPGADLSESTVDELILQANTIYAAAQTYLSEGNWAGYGEEMTALQAVLERLAEVSGVELVPVEVIPDETAPAPADVPAPAEDAAPDPTPASDG